MQASYGRFPRWDLINADRHPFWRIVRRDIHRVPGLETEPVTFVEYPPPLWNWGLASGPETTSNTSIPESLRPAFPYRAWGFFLGGLRGDLGYLPLLLERFKAEFPADQPFSNEIAANALRDVLRTYTGNPDWRIGHFMANAVELTGRSNSARADLTLLSEELCLEIAYSLKDNRQYKGNGAVNWAIASDFGASLLVSPATAQQSNQSVLAVNLALRPMAASSIRFMKEGASRWRVECTDSATKNDWKLQIRVGDAPIVPGAEEADGNKWTGLGVGEAKDGVIEVVSADYVESTSCTSRQTSGLRTRHSRKTGHTRLRRTVELSGDESTSTQGPGGILVEIDTAGSVCPRRLGGRDFMRRTRPEGSSV